MHQEAPGEDRAVSSPSKGALYARSTRQYPMVHLLFRGLPLVLGVVNCLFVAPWGGADIGEVDQMGRRLRKNVGNGALWFGEWVRMANKVRGLAIEAEEKDHCLRGC